ncbi:hypothetical protein AVEN_257356-1 [Araneus ventricosus]|uniref:Uncharacterized protein n=1 Tax=Araneus ventricosus TaxID=182803 RepID=A0A4Y2C9K1_ARAVE|nr:hypothetical protein AVEN_257356-1 [Araneus ventricosus]
MYEKIFFIYNLITSLGAIFSPLVLFDFYGQDFIAAPLTHWVYGLLRSTEEEGLRKFSGFLDVRLEPGWEVASKGGGEVPRNAFGVLLIDKIATPRAPCCEWGCWQKKCSEIKNAMPRCVGMKIAPLNYDCM